MIHYGRPVMAVLLMLLAGALHADNGLTRDAVERWLSSMEDIQQWSEQQQADVDLSDDRELDGSRDLERMRTQSAREHREMRDILSRHGFSNADAWANTGNRIVEAFVALQMREMEPQVQAEMERAMQQIDDNPHMDEQQKQMMREQVRSSMEQQQRQLDSVPAGDLRAVESMQGELDAYFDQ